MGKMIKDWFKVNAGVILLICPILFSLLLLICPTYGVLAFLTLLFVWLILYAVRCTFPKREDCDVESNVVVEREEVKPTEWAYISKIDGKEYHISIFKDEISKLYRIADLERHTIFPQVFEDYDDINEWLNKQTNCVMGLCIYSHSNRDKLEEMEREYEKEMSKPLKAKVKDGGYEVELTRDPDDENHFYVIGENGRTLSDYNRDQLEFFDDETDNT